MGMRSYANSAYVVSEDFVKSIAPLEFNALIVLIDGDDDLDWGTFSQDMMYGDTISFGDDVINAYDRLVEEFNKQTDLSLGIAYMDDEADTDMDYGHFWAVGGVMETTEAGKKYANEISYESYVVFG